MSAVDTEGGTLEKRAPQWTTMGEIADVVGGGTPRTNDSTNFEGGDIPWLTPADLSGYTEKYVSHGSRSITKKGLASSAARMVPPGTVLFTSRAPIGYVAIARNAISTNQGFKSFVLKQGVLPEYVYWWLKRSKQTAESFASGTTFLELSGANAKKLPIPIVPLHQQREIVAEIEKQFSRLDQAVANLKRVKANLKRYKAAVLKAAVEGRLVPTEAELARKEGRTYETGSEFLNCIVNNQRKNLNTKGRYKEPISLQNSFAPALPDGWVWASADQVCAQITDGEHIQPKYQSTGFPMLTAKHVRDGYVSFKHVELIGEADFLNCLRRCAPSFGDILIVSVGATTGRVAIVTTDEPFALVRSVLLLKPIVPSRYMLGAIQSPLVQKYIRRASGSTAQAHLYIKDTKAMPIPLPPLAEQIRISEEIERCFSLVRRVEIQTEANLRRAERMRQSILAKMFSTPVSVVAEDEAA